MRKILHNIYSDSTAQTIVGLGLTIAYDEKYEINVNDFDVYARDQDLIQAVRDGKIQVGWWDNSFFTDPLEGEIYLRDLGAATILISDGTSIQEVNPGIVTDTGTGKKGISPWVSIVMLQKEIYNGVTNPLYDADFNPVLSRTNNLELIHGKMGWHNQELQQAKYQKPKNILFYYGWLNSYNSATNAWYNERVAQDMARYNMIVYGDGIADPSHGDYANSAIIVPRVKELNLRATTFGYVTIFQSIANFKTKVDQWVTLGVDGIFLDEAGYDYGTTATNDREAFNERVDYVHDQGKIAFANAWDFDNVLGTANSASFPNSTWNPSEIESSLTEDDWYLLESFTVHTTSYAGDYATGSDWHGRGEKAIGLRDTYGVNIAAVNVIDNGEANGQDMYDFSFIAACMYALNAHGSADSWYGASSAAVNMWDRPDVTMMGPVYERMPIVQQDNDDSDVYWRYTESGRFKLDFSSSAQSSLIDKL